METSDRKIQSQTFKVEVKDDVYGWKSYVVNINAYKYVNIRYVTIPNPMWHQGIPV